MAKTLISTHTADGSSTSIDITSGIDDTYSVYEFHYVNMHLQSDGERLQFQFNADGGSGFNENMTTTSFMASHGEDDSGGSLAYQGDFSMDQANADARDQPLGVGIGADADQSISGVLTLYDPSSTTYVKHFVARSVHPQNGDEARDMHVAGYINTTSAIDETSFRTNTGNLDAGTIKMFGVS